MCSRWSARPTFFALRGRDRDARGAWELTRGRPHLRPQTADLPPNSPGSVAGPAGAPAAAAAAVAAGGEESDEEKEEQEADHNNTKVKTKT